MLENSPSGKNSLIELEEVEQEELNVDVDGFTPKAIIHTTAFSTCLKTQGPLTHATREHMGKQRRNEIAELQACLWEHFDFG